MIPVLSRQEMRELDRRASDVHQVPSLLLMENAGRGACDVIVRELAARAAPARRVVIAAGPGNNGGDGFVVARRLLVLGIETEVFLMTPSDRLKGDAASNYRSFTGVGGRVTELPPTELAAFGEAMASAGAVVDALLGTGLDREVTGAMRYAIEFVNAAPCRRFSLDIPSGLDADTGAVLGAAVRAHETITFAHPKLGLCTPSGAEYAGRVHVVDIGVPPSCSKAILHRAALVERADVTRLSRARRASLHKSSAGRVLVIAGSPGKVGAALLVAEGALRAGAGLVTLAARPDVATTLEQRVLEAMTARIDFDALEASLGPLLERSDAVAIGPGIGLDGATRRLVDHVVLGWDGVKVVDADAITHFTGRADALRQAPGRVVLTPHSGELGRLLGISAEEVENNRLHALERAVEATGAVVLLKGRFTLVGAPAELALVNPTGNSALATGGTGDVLSGIVAGLACSLHPREAAFAGAYLHGAAAESWAARVAGPSGVADRGLLAHEIATELPAVFASLNAAH